MSTAPTHMDAIREQIRRIETGSRVSRGFLPFGEPEIDDRLSGLKSTTSSFVASVAAD